jgi:uncharacterized membrane protein (DUF106 family)
MAFFSFLDPALNFLLGWSLLLPPWLGVLLLSFAISLMVVIIYKFTTDQNLMKQLKEEMQAFQKEMKELRDHPEKALEVQGKAMETNMKYMMQSFRSTLFTMLPIILIFGWLNAHLAFAALAPGQEFPVELKFNQGVTGTITTLAPDGLELTTDGNKTISDGSAIFTFKGDTEGAHTLAFRFGNKDYTKDVLITSSRNYDPPIDTFPDGDVKSITVGLKKLVVTNLFGWQIGWLGTYILWSLLFSIVLRKLLNVY